MNTYLNFLRPKVRTLPSASGLMTAGSVARGVLQGQSLRSASSSSGPEAEWQHCVDTAFRSSKFAPHASRGCASLLFHNLVVAVVVFSALFVKTNIRCFKPGISFSIQ
jgi:hypothetical protein